jgi:hypothetical protein
MKCLRCGYCCKSYFVVIVKDPDKGIVESNLTVHEGKGPCPHLRGSKPGEYSCVVHGRPWYKKTPCFDHTQVEKGNQLCRIGARLLEKEGQKR